MSKYVILQFIQLVLIILVKFYYSSNIVLLNILTLTPILLSVFYATYYHTNIEEDSKLLYFSLIAAVFGDICLIYFNQALGISFFFIAQSFYYSYLNKGKDLKILIPFVIINSLFCYHYGNNALMPEAALYALITLFNVIKSIKLIIRKKIKVAYFMSFIFLMLCDVSLFLLFVFTEYKINLINIDIFYVIEWISYIMFQTLLVTSLTNYVDEHIIEFLENLVKPYQIEDEINNEEITHKKLL